MKKLIVAAAGVCGVLVALYRFGPGLRERAMRKCEEMLDRMPDEFPPKRMMRNMEEIREQNERILHRLEQGYGRPAGVAAD